MFSFETGNMVERSPECLELYVLPLQGEDLVRDLLEGRRSLVLVQG